MTGDVAVIGAGPGGLGAAYRLTEAGYRVHVFDDRDYPGGKMRTTRRDGFLIDEGPQIMPSCYDNVLGIARDSGMGADILDAGSTFGYRGPDKLHFIDTNHMLRSGLKFDLLSARGKLAMARLILDTVRTRGRFNFEDLSSAAEFDFEDAATYALRRSNAEVLEFVADPTIRALVGVPAAEVSAVEFRFGFLKFMGSKYKIFRDGMGSYAHHLARNFEMRLRSEVTAVEETGSRVTVRWVDQGGSECHETFDGCVICTDGRTTRRIHRGLDDERAGFLDRLRYTTHVNVTAALAHAPEDNPAFWINIPASVAPGLIVMTLEHNKHPNRAPAGKGLLHVDCTAEWAADLAGKDDGVVVKEVMEAADAILPGVSADVEFADVHRWDPMVLRSRPGYYRELKVFSERCRRFDGRIQIGGDYFCQSSINSATAAGERAARGLRAALG
ncbi:MAG TPA: NAD(P)/FAD-dependent oxidoreductase [Pseudonocardia sp.]|nr:NAD(P)/FAD-dependent oxidoreductase [Pseudonocardia sp.]